MAKTIPLTKGFEAIVDEEDFKWISQWKWHYCNEYAATWDYSEKPKQCVFMHRLINQTPPGIETDHINHDKFDNRKSNLRNATKSQNAMNGNITWKGNTSGYRGVSWNKEKKKWYAQIAVSRKKINLGYFVTREEAALAYNQAAIKYHKEFACLNKVG